MKAMVLEEIAPIESSPLVLRELPDPQPGAGQVRLAVRCCAICRTDLHVIEGELPRQKLLAIPIRPHTTVYRLDQANQALQDLKADRINGTGVLVVGGLPAPPG